MKRLFPMLLLLLAVGCSSPSPVVVIPPPDPVTPSDSTVVDKITKFVEDIGAAKSSDIVTAAVAADSVSFASIEADSNPGPDLNVGAVEAVDEAEDAGAFYNITFEKIAEDENTFTLQLSVEGVENFDRGFFAMQIFEIVTPSGVELVSCNTNEGIIGSSAYPFYSLCRVSNARVGGFGSSRDAVHVSGVLGDFVFTREPGASGTIWLDQFYFSYSCLTIANTTTACTFPQLPERSVFKL